MLQLTSHHGPMFKGIQWSWVQVLVVCLDSVVPCSCNVATEEVVPANGLLLFKCMDETWKEGSFGISSHAGGVIGFQFSH